MSKRDEVRGMFMNALVATGKNEVTVQECK
jgi:hypothetical protein